MSTLCTKYYCFLEHTLDFTSLINRIDNDCTNIMSWCLQHDFINCNIQELIDLLPRYLYYSRFTNTRKLSSGYNHELIYNATTMSQAQLTSEVDKDPTLSSLNIKLKYTPEYLEDQIKEYTLQNNYFISMDDLIFNKNFYYRNYFSTAYIDKFSNLLNELSDESLSGIFKNILNRHSFFHLYFINSLVNYIFKKRSNLSKSLLVNSKDFTIPVIETSVNQYSNNIIDLVLMNQFSFVNIKNDFKTRIYNDTTIQTAISEIDSLFSDYITENIDNFKETVLDTVFESINQFSSFNVLKKIFNSSMYFNFTRINEIFSYNTFTSQEAKELMNLYLVTLDFKGNSLSNFENDLYVFHIKNLNNDFSMKNYYYLLYLYRQKIQRFVNVIDLVANEYVSNNIKFDALTHFSTFEHLSNLFNDWCSCIRKTNFINVLNTTFTINKSQDLLDQHPDILSMSYVSAYQKQIENFVISESFKNQVNKIHKSIYSYLRTNGLMSSDNDWCNCTQPLEVYLFFVLKKLIKNVSTTSLYNYVSGVISKFEYKTFESEASYDYALRDFNISYSYYLFEFYKSFTKSIVSAVFSDALHTKYSL